MLILDLLGFAEGILSDSSSQAGKSPFGTLLSHLCIKTIHKWHFHLDRSIVTQVLAYLSNTMDNILTHNFCRKFKYRFMCPEWCLNAWDDFWTWYKKETLQPIDKKETPIRACYENMWYGTHVWSRVTMPNIIYQFLDETRQKIVCIISEWIENCDWTMFVVQ